MPLGTRREVCNKRVSIKKLFSILWAIMHFSHEECDCRAIFILCCAASARSKEV